MDDDKIYAIAISFILMAIVFFGLGWCTGFDAAKKDIKQELCKAFIVKTVDYINCNSSDKSIDVVIKLIKGVSND